MPTKVIGTTSKSKTRSSMDWILVVWVLLCVIAFPFAVVADEKRPCSFTSISADLLEELEKYEKQDGQRSVSG